MKNLATAFAGLICLLGFTGNQPGPKKGICPLKNGIIRSVPADSSIIGSMKATVQIIGTDGLVRSATDGRVREVFPVIAPRPGFRIAIVRDTATYSYFGFDSCLVKEGQLVKSGQVIGYSASQKMYFFVSDYLYTHLSATPQNYVDCVCELPK